MSKEDQRPVIHSRGMRSGETEGKLPRCSQALGGEASRQDLISAPLPRFWVPMGLSLAGRVCEQES